MLVIANLSKLKHIHLYFNEYYSDLFKGKISKQLSNSVNTLALQ